jgi:hypothetical protein
MVEFKLQKLKKSCELEVLRGQIRTLNLQQLNNRVMMMPLNKYQSIKGAVRTPPRQPREGKRLSQPRPPSLIPAGRDPRRDSLQGQAPSRLP